MVLAGRKGTSSTEKGRVAERVVAMLHEGLGAEVRRDVRLPAKNDRARHRQVDVLLLGEAAGHQTAIAIECKNFKRPVNVRDVGAFADLLDDVGFAPQQGILVSAGKIGSGAMSRARQIGMKVLELSGLTADGLSEAVQAASQAVVFIVPSLSELSVINEVGRADSREVLLLHDPGGELVCYVHDFLWLRWLEGEPPSALGEYDLEVPVPDGWHTVVGGRRFPVLSASAKVRVRAAVVEYPGTASSFALLDPEDRSVERLRTTATFDTIGERPVGVFEEEPQLEALAAGGAGGLRVTVGRIRMPRIQVNHVYWPLSVRVRRRVSQYYKFYRKGRIGVARPEDFAGIEGDNLMTFWEPIAQDQPALELLRRRRDGRLGA